MARSGSLVITLKRARDLQVVQRIGIQDPYCVVTVEGRRQKTDVHDDGGTNPIWNETMYFDRVPANAVISIEIIDKNCLFFKDVSIGKCEIQLAKVLRQENDLFDIPVRTTRGTIKGVLSLSIVYTGPTANGSSNSKKKKQIWIFDTYKGRNIDKDYEMLCVLGKGSFGVTYKVQHTSTGAVYACKIISKTKMRLPEEIEDIRREVRILNLMKGHPNVVQLHDVYEDINSVYLIMECCHGGELFDHIVNSGQLSERDAAGIVRTMLSVVGHCHDVNVVHRDLKPENFLLTDKTPNAVLKAIDFGMATFHHEGQVLTDVVGSMLYVAPEVLGGKYGKEVDIWSCGVIMYVLLTGLPPFSGETDRQVELQILRTEPDYAGLSPAARDCLKQMLVKDPKRRASAREILNHHWVREHGGGASDKPLQCEVVRRLNAFSTMNRLKKEALKMIVDHLPYEEVVGLKELFQALDRDGSGTITLEEFRNALEKKGQDVHQDELERLMKMADLNGDQTIDIHEFMAATLGAAEAIREEHLMLAFDQMDENGDGFLSREELTHALADCNIREVNSLLDQVDEDGDGSINYMEFARMFHDKMKVTA